MATTPNHHNSSNTATISLLIQDLQECMDSVDFQVPNYFASEVVDDVVGNIGNNDMGGDLSGVEGRFV